MDGEFQRRLVALAAAIAVAGFGLIVAGCGDELTDSEQPPAAGSPGAMPTEEFGSEAQGEERARIVAAFDAYMSALAAGDYTTACRHLNREARTQLERAGSKQGGGGCPRALAAFHGDARQSAAQEIEQVRVDGDTAQVIFSVVGAEPQYTRMSRQGGEWKAGLLSLPVRSPAS